MNLCGLEQEFQKRGITAQLKVALAPYTTFRIGGPCEMLVKPKTIAELSEAFSLVKSSGAPYYFLGNGSNLLVSDEGYPGIVLLTTGLSCISFPEDSLMECEAGVSLSKLCSTALEHSLAGAEFAWGIPGSVGGAVYMNAGAYGGEIKDILESCTFFSREGDLCTLPGDHLELSYRHSRFSDCGDLIVSARFRLHPDSPQAIKDRMDDYIGRRKSKQPLEYPSAGSTFKRPEGNYAGALIEQCGLKGCSVGGAQVSEKHSGFVINRGGVTCSDVLKLIEKIKTTVYRQTGCQLECEIKTLGL